MRAPCSISTVNVPPHSLPVRVVEAGQPAAGRCLAVWPGRKEAPARHAWAPRLAWEWRSSSALGSPGMPRQGLERCPAGTRALPLPAVLSAGARPPPPPPGAGLQRDWHQWLPQRLPLRPRWCAPGSLRPGPIVPARLPWQPVASAGVCLATPCSTTCSTLPRPDVVVVKTMPLTAGTTSLPPPSSRHELPRHGHQGGEEWPPGHDRLRGLRGAGGRRGAGAGVTRPPCAHRAGRQRLADAAAALRTGRRCRDAWGLGDRDASAHHVCVPRCLVSPPAGAADPPGPH